MYRSDWSQLFYIPDVHVSLSFTVSFGFYYNSNLTFLSLRQSNEPEVDSDLIRSASRMHWATMQHGDTLIVRLQLLLPDQPSRTSSFSGHLCSYKRPTGYGTPHSVITSPLIGVWSIVISMSVCLLLETTRPNFSKFSEHVTCGRSSYLLWR